MSSERMNSPSVIVPVGPSAEHFQGLIDIFDALALYEPDGCHVLALCDGTEELVEQVPTPSGVILETLAHPRAGLRNAVGAGASGTLAAFAHLVQRRPNLIVKLDTDGLLIGRCFERLEAFFASNCTTGVVGSARRGARCADWARVANRLKLPISLWRQPAPGYRHVVQVVFGRHRRVAAWLRRARGAGWEPGSYCQGGGYAVSPRLLFALAEAGALARPLDWLGIPLTEDVVVGALAAACGFGLADLSGPGDVFGCEYGRLPHPAPQMIARGHAVIHSLKGDPVGRSGPELRAFFASAREADRRRHGGLGGDSSTDFGPRSLGFG
jgi:hypothetical protein